MQETLRQIGHDTPVDSHMDVLVSFLLCRPFFRPTYRRQQGRQKTRWPQPFMIISGRALRQIMQSSESSIKSTETSASSATASAFAFGTTILSLPSWHRFERPLARGICTASTSIFLKHCSTASMESSFCLLGSSAHRRVEGVPVMAQLSCSRSMCPSSHPLGYMKPNLMAFNLFAMLRSPLCPTIVRSFRHLSTSSSNLGLSSEYAFTFTRT
mmetsp:Transcript_152993/g.269937  ORF Transcript_152993/g.269937 Transcript_152993/m.269937 type:complete len:213 (+) Transcript_152993:640-1278(+)